MLSYPQLFFWLNFGNITYLSLIVYEIKKKHYFAKIVLELETIYIN